MEMLVKSGYKKLTLNSWVKRVDDVTDFVVIDSKHNPKGIVAYKINAGAIFVDPVCFDTLEEAVSYLELVDD